MKRPLALLSAAAVIAAGLALSPARAADDTAVPAADELADVPRRHGRALARQLDLTADQRQAFKEVMRTHQPLLRPLLEQARAEREALRTIIAAPALDEATLATQAERIAATQKQIVVASAHARADLRRILTAEQLAKLDDLRASTVKRAQHRGAKFQEWLLKP